MLNYATIPNPSGVSLMKDYFEKGMPFDRNDFYYELVTNDLRGAVLTADMHNQRNLVAWVQWLWNEAPGGSWGSVENYNAWLNSGGTEGQEKARAHALQSEVNV